ncbi:SGNH/GDSL hydrolase family protein [Nigerium massiliense]|uniref:SGNH/GDSL hydrolase family protein n=1 Tax=Nigerium massiliense TaxID=1522317 RepID=UPI001C4446BE|nr:SGNH/GDSL hydrolase family protein [Nigerium massiliense]
MKTFIRRAFAALTIVAGASSVLTAPPAHAATAAPGYVALGDSYAAGAGAGNYINDGSGCRRSANTHDVLIAQSQGLALDLQACSGAVVADVAGRQLGALNASTAYVTISAGGNDVGFSHVISECAQPGWMSNCNGAIDDALATANNALPGRLAGLYASVRARAPHAKVTVTGYPLLFNGTDCHVLTFFSGDEMSRLNSATRRLDAILAGEAAKAGFAFADVRGIMAGHAVCDRPAWITNLTTLSAGDSYHPNADGQRYGYAPPTSAAMGVGGPVSGMGTRAASVRTGTTTSSDTRRGRITIPDLTTPAARRKAAAAGVTRAELDAIVRAQRSGASNATLERMSVAATR